MKQSHPARTPSVHCSFESPSQLLSVHMGFKTSQLRATRVPCQSLLCLALLCNWAYSCSLFGVQLCTGHRRSLHIVHHRNLGCTRPRYMPLDTDSPGSVAVDTIQIRLHTLNIHSLDSLGTSPRLGLAFLGADDGLGKSSSLSAIYGSRSTYGRYEAYRWWRNWDDRNYHHSSTAQMSVHHFRV